MKIYTVLTALVFLFFTAQAQTIAYSEILKKDSRSMDFEVLGNVQGNTLIYKILNDNHRLTIYDNSMKVLNDVKLDFISDRTFNIDFIVYPQFVYAIFQSQRGGNVYSKMAKIDGQGQLIGEIRNLDTARVGFFAANKVHFLNVSDNKERIVVYKLQTRNNDLQLLASVYNNEFKKVDSASLELDDSNRREVFSDLKIANDGSIFFVKQHRKGFSDYMNKSELYIKKVGEEGFSIKTITEEKYFLDEMELKIDNQNQIVFANCFTYNSNFGNANGLLTVAFNKLTGEEKGRSIISFSDSIKNKLTSSRRRSNDPFSNFEIKSVLNKRDSGLLITLEENITESRGGFNNPFGFGRSGFLGYDPFMFNNNAGFYRFQRGGFNDNFYSPFNNGQNNGNALYLSNDVVMMSIGGNLKLQWENVINKKQSDVESDNHLSYGTVNLGGQIHYLYILKDNNKEVISDNALLPNGEIKRYATIKSGQKGYNFMPRLSKQVSSNSIVLPAVTRNNIAFVKIFFN